MQRPAFAQAFGFGHPGQGFMGCVLGWGVVVFSPFWKDGHMTKIEKLIGQLQEAIGEAIAEAELRGEQRAGQKLMGQIAAMAGVIEKPKRGRKAKP